jgi:hypothetical protein
MKRSIAILLAVLLSHSAIAAIAPKYAGEFRFDPKAGHSAAITGALELVAITANELTAFSEVTLTPSAPVYGKKELRSDKLLTLAMQENGSDHLALITNLKGTPHKWFFVWLLQSVDGGITYQATFHKVPGKLEEIQDSIKKAIEKGTPLPAAEWKLVGEGNILANLWSMRERPKGYAVDEIFELLNLLDIVRFPDDLGFIWKRLEKGVDCHLSHAKKPLRFRTELFVSR